MNNEAKFDLLNMSEDIQFTIKSIVDIITENIWPLMINIKHKLSSENSSNTTEYIERLTEVFTLCCSQIKKCLLQTFETFKLERLHKCILQESRVSLSERLSCCVNKLESIHNCLNNTLIDIDGNNSTDSLFVSPMYFVNWIDHTFELLTKLSSLIYRNDGDNCDGSIEDWKNELVECVKSLHLSVDELLLSAVTLSKYSLPVDQNIVTARCQVVLRETKTLFTELINGDLEDQCLIKVDSLKLPLMPSNVNILIDVLKDVLYVLETNTNTALLNLVVYCFSYSPIDLLKDHFKEKCSCNSENNIDDCNVVKEFDLYNERLLQIGSFAVSCSTDQKRILSVRSGTASLEALEAHLVPAVVMSSEGLHSQTLISTWSREVAEIRDNVFLIVDPAAFVEKCKQSMHTSLLDVIRSNIYSHDAVQNVINIGCVLYDFFATYIENEPEALTLKDKLELLLNDLNKVQKECKTVSNMLRSETNIDGEKQNVAMLEKLIKRLKLLYTLVTRMNNVYNKDDQDETFGNNTDTTKDMTKNITYVKESSRTNNKTITLGRSIFKRTVNDDTKNIIKKLSKHLNSKKNEQLNFSVQLDKLLIDSSLNCGKGKHSILYSPLKTKSLRKTLLNKNYVLPSNVGKLNQTFNKSEALDITAALQITEILDQFTDMSIPVAATNQSILNITTTIKGKNECKSNVLTLNINDGNDSISKHIWNIPVHSDIVDICLDNSGDVTTSNIGTLERVNDINLLENKLKDLKLIQKETSL